MVLEGVTGFRLMTQASEFGDRLAALEGRVVHAKVLDVQGSKVTVRVEGQIVTAESDVTLQPSAEIDLVVRGAEGGKIMMQVVSSSGDAPIRPLTDSAISSRLMGIDIAPSRVTIAAARALIAHDLPVTKENVRAILAALPPDAPDEQITFQASALRAGIQPTKELLPLQALLKQHLGELPADIRDVFRGLAETLRQLPAQTREAFAETVALEKLLSLLPAPDSEAAKDIAEKLADFARNTLFPTEARLASAILPQAAAAPMAAPQPSGLSAFVETILLVLLSLKAPSDRAAASESLQNIQTALSELEQLPLEETAFIKDSESLRSQVKETIGNVRQTLTELEAAIAKNDMPRAEALLQEVRLQMQRLMAAFGSEVREYLKSIPEAEPGAAEQLAVKQPELFTLVSDLAQTAAQTGDPEKLERLFQEILLRLSLQLLPRAAELAAAPSPRTPPVLRDALSWLVEALRVAVEGFGKSSAEQQPRIQALIAELNNLIEQAAPRTAPAQLDSDLRLMLGRLIQTMESGEGLRDAASSLARNVQLASFSTAVQHTGADPTGAITVLFPIHYRDRVDVGILKIRTDPERKKKGKPLDPFNANIVLVLDTEYLGMSTTYLNTYPKSLQCVIEVESKRIKKVVEKFVAELEDALRATVYENINVEVRLRKRKGAAKKDTGKKQPAAIDFRI